MKNWSESVSLGLLLPQVARGIRLCFPTSYDRVGSDKPGVERQVVRSFCPRCFVWVTAKVAGFIGKGLRACQCVGVYAEGIAIFCRDWSECRHP